MRTTSQYIAIDNQNFLIEFEYNSKIISTDDCNFLRLKNAYTGSINYISHNPTNYQKAVDLTGNVLDRSCQQTTENSFVHFDIDRPLKYFEGLNRSLVFESLVEDITQEIFVTYNTIRIHVLSGYTFDDIAGLICRAMYIDDNFNQVFVANIAYLKEETINFNPRPFRIGDRVYDRFVEIRIPTLKSLKDIDTQISEEFKSNDSLFYYKGEFPDINTSKINLLFYEVQEYETDTEGQLILNTVLPLNSDSNGLIKRELNIADEFSGIYAVVQESGNGDFFELFPSYEGEFLEDFLSERNQVLGEEYLVIHDIELYEQLFDIAGYSEVQTQSFSQIQESGFENPFDFRPIIKNPNTIAFTIEYTVRLFNKTNPGYIIRRASYTYKNAKKYGRYMEKLDIPLGFQPVRIVNKILNTSKTSLLSSNPYSIISSTNENSNSSDTIERNIFIPAQILNISINAKTLYITKAPTSNLIEEIVPINKFEFKDLINNEVVYGQGDGILFLSKFDNFVKVKIFKDSNNKLEPYTDLINNENLKIYLIFEDVNGEKIQIPSYYINNLVLETDTQPGEVLFKISSSFSTKILQSSNNRFWIVVENITKSQNADNEVVKEFKDFETVLYTGSFYNIDNYKSIYDPNYQSKAKLLQDKIDEFNTKVKEVDTLQDKISNIDTNLSSLSNSDKSLLEDYVKQIQNMMKEAYS